MKKKQEEKVELLEESKELEQDTKLNEEMLKLEEEINTLTDQNKGLVEKVKLAQAELINYRKRKDEETEGLLKYANTGIITEILPIIDTFEKSGIVKKRTLEKLRWRTKQQLQNYIDEVKNND